MKNIFLFAVLFTCFHFCNAQLRTDDKIYKEIMSKDSLLFNVGFNKCEVSQFENILGDDFEFFHDKSGVSDKQKFLSDFKNGLCKNPKPYSKRILLKKSVKIYPLYDNGSLYGAIQEGEHLFYEKGQRIPGIAKFTSTWQIQNNDWKLTKSLSYDHREYLTKKDNDLKINKVFAED